jgi:multicomponent Na+:H+ antiporter subunit G
MTVAAIVVLLLGSAFMLIASLGVLRFPDLFIRMHAATKAGTLGAGLLLVAVALTAGDTGITVRAIATIVFLFITAPIGAHVIGRAAYHSGQVRLWDRTVRDELAGDGRMETDEPTKVRGSNIRGGSA